MNAIYSKSFVAAMAFSASACAFFTACDDDDNLIAADALFRPVLTDDNITSGIDDNNKPYFIIKWDNYTDADQYIVSIEANDGSDTRSVTTSELTCQFDNLNYDTEYNISIVASNTINGLKSKAFTKVVTSNDYPTKLKTFSSDNIIDTQARVTWDESVSYDSIMVYQNSNDSLVTTLKDIQELSSDIIRGLEPKTEYRVEAYFAGEYMGKKIFKTVASENYIGVVCDLRSLTEEESLKAITSGGSYANLVDSLLKTYPGEDVTIVLQGGVQYKVSGVISQTDKKVTFVTGLTLNGNAQFISTGGFSLNSEENVATIQFEKIDFIADNYESNYPDGIVAGVAIQKGSRQVFNLNLTTSTTLDSLIFKGCTFKGYRAIVRQQGAGTADAHSAINNVVFSDCQANAIGDQGVVTTSNKANAFKNIIISNSTFANVLTPFDFRSSLENITLNISNSTFCYCGTAQLINSAKDAVTVNIDNTIFNGSCDATSANTAGTADYKFYANAINQNKIADNYRLDNYTLANTGTEEAPAYNELNETTIISATDVQAFSNPAEGDFTVTNATLIKAAVGDPRWL